MWNGSRFEQHIHLLRGEFNIHGLKWKMSCHVIIVTETELSGFVVTLHLGFSARNSETRSLWAEVLDFLFRTRPCALW